MRKGGLLNENNRKEFFFTTNIQPMICFDFIGQKSGGQLDLGGGERGLKGDVQKSGTFIRELLYKGGRGHHSANFGRKSTTFYF